MNKSIEVLKSIYKPYRYTIKGKSTILETTCGDFIIKPKNKDINELYTYLTNRGFMNYPKIIDSSRDEVNVFEYVEDIKLPKEQKCDDLIEIIASLHNKTSYFKEVSEDKFKSIHEDIKSNISYLSNYYNTLYEIGFNEVYASPSNYIFMRNYFKINAALEYANSELDNWYSLVKENNKGRNTPHPNNLLEFFGSIILPKRNKDTPNAIVFTISNAMFPKKPENITLKNTHHARANPPGANTLFKTPCQLACSGLVNNENKRSSP